MELQARARSLVDRRKWSSTLAAAEDYLMGMVTSQGDEGPGTPRRRRCESH